MIADCRWFMVCDGGLFVAGCWLVGWLAGWLVGVHVCVRVRVYVCVSLFICVLGSCRVLTAGSDRGP